MSIAPQTPNNIMVTYMAGQSRQRIWMAPARVLDIGSHSLANALWLRDHGFDVTTIDSDPEAWATIHGGIEHAGFRFPPEFFDYIIDINTLCHVECPPYSDIRDWLVPEGRFFSICPAWDTDPLVAEGKSFTRFSSEDGLRDSLKMFTQVAIFPSEYPHFPGQLKSWVVEARK